MKQNDAMAALEENKGDFKRPPVLPRLKELLNDLRSKDGRENSKEWYIVCDAIQALEAQCDVKENANPLTSQADDVKSFNATPDTLEVDLDEIRCNGMYDYEQGWVDLKEYLQGAYRGKTIKIKEDE